MLIMFRLRGLALCESFSSRRNMPIDKLRQRVRLYTVDVGLQKLHENFPFLPFDSDSLRQLIVQFFTMMDTAAKKT